jgi:uncharacterized protein YneF (UPF0154 family)
MEVVMGLLVALAVGFVIGVVVGVQFIAWAVMSKVGKLREAGKVTDAEVDTLISVLGRKP